MDIAVQHGGLAEMCAEEVAGEQNLLLRHPSEHGIRPMQQRRNNEFQLLATDVQFISVFGYNAGEVVVCDRAQVFLSSGRADNRDIRVLFQKLCHRTRVIRLGVVHDQIVNFRDVYNTLDVVQIFVKEISFNGLHQDVLLACDQIRVVACAIARFHYNVKHTQRRI